jgi:DNA/RNA-binding domain of Phe-tRNA-synthetase-like protein
MPWSVVLGVVTVCGVNWEALEGAIASAQQAATFDVRHASGPAARRIQAFEAFFTQNGFRSPLGIQLKSIQEKGLPGGSPLVRALLLSEMTTGLLMGAQDAAEIKDVLVCDLAAGDETFRGMRTEVMCRKGEIVLRDSEGIIATLFQGPDYRTRLKKETKDVVFFIFSVPGVSAGEVREGVDAVQDLLQASCAEVHGQVYESRAPALL